MNETPSAAQRPWHKCLVVLLLSTGMRRSEIAQISLEDLDLENRQLLVHGKGAKERIVPLADQAVAAIEQYLPRRKKTDSHRLFVLHLGTRRIVLAEATFSPHGQWTGQMARNLLMSCEDLEIAPRFVLHDRDKLLAWDFDGVLSGAQTKVVKTPFRAPDANAHAERWVRSVTEECLDHLVLVGMGSLQRALRIYQSFFNGHRPHQGIDNRIPERRAKGEAPRDCAEAMPEGKLTVECEQFLGGLLNSYYRKAA